MNSITFTASPSASLSVKTLFLPSQRSIFTGHGRIMKFKQRKRWMRDGNCRAEMSTDAPVAAAIGACILNSLVFPLAPLPEDVEGESLIDSTDARFAVMGIISFIPYFNWMSWVFAWLDTGNRRYALYAIVYLAPYFRPDLSISPEESWLPIASIILCIIHIQLEASVKNGDFQGFQILNEAARMITGRNKVKEHHNLSSSQEDYRDKIKKWSTRRRSSEDHENLVDEEEEDD